MTAADPGADTATQLAALLADWDTLPPIARMPSAQRHAVAAALLPVVDRIARHRAAHELDDLAARIHGRDGTAGTASRIWDYTRVRAAALRAEP